MAGNPCEELSPTGGKKKKIYMHNIEHLDDTNELVVFVCHILFTLQEDLLHLVSPILLLFISRNIKVAHFLLLMHRRFHSQQFRNSTHETQQTVLVRNPVTLACLLVVSNPIHPRQVSNISEHSPILHAQAFKRA